MTASQRRPSSRAWPSTRSRPTSDSRIERLTFLRLWVSDADRKTLISWKRPWLTSAFCRPRSLGISTETETSSGRSIAASTSSASASWGMTSARTKLVDLDAPQAGAHERVDEPHLVVGGDDLGLVLEAVARTDLADAHALWKV